MILISLMAVAAAAPAPSSRGCDKLARDFVRIEVALGANNQKNEKLAKLKQGFGSQAEAYSLPRKWRAEIEDADLKLRAEADRVVRRMAAQGCPPPDHAASALTYKSDYDTCDAARDAVDRKRLCDVAGIALSRAARPR